MSERLVAGRKVDCQGQKEWHWQTGSQKGKKQTLIHGTLLVSSVETLQPLPILNYLCNVTKPVVLRRDVPNLALPSGYSDISQC